MYLRKVRILLVENDQDFLDMIENLLMAKLKDISITKASSPEDALKCVMNGYFDIAVVDKRLIQDNDPKDESGIQLVLDILDIHPGLKIFMLTSFPKPRYNIVHKIPHQDEHDEKVLCNYMSKADPPEEWCSGIARIIEKDIRINFSLNIELLGHEFESLNQLLNSVKIKHKLKKANDPDIDLIDTGPIELRDLLGKIYYESDEITLLPIQWGYSGTGVIKVYRDQNLLEIFKFGSREKIETEYDNYKKHVAGKISERTFIDKGKFARTKNLAGIAYSFIGADIDKMKDFGKYFLENEANQINNFLENFFSGNCGIWYKRIQSEKPADLKKVYTEYWNLDESNLWKQIQKHLPPDYSERDVKLDNFGLNFENPCFALKHFNFGLFKIKICRTHGDLNARNILVDKDRGWLIDFYSTGYGHALRDFLKLETSIKFELSGMENLAALIRLEEALLEPNSFSEEYKPNDFINNRHLIKSYECIKYLRELARDLIRPTEDIWEYYTGLFFTTLKQLEFDEVPGLDGHENQVRRKFAFISAGLIFDKLKNKGLVKKV